MYVTVEMMDYALFQLKRTYSFMLHSSNWENGKDIDDFSYCGNLSIKMKVINDFLSRVYLAAIDDIENNM